MAFSLQSVQFTTLTRLTLTFTDTLSPLSPANVNPNNYVISGDIEVVGNFAIAGSSISFDITQARAGRVYDVTVSNIVSSQNTLIGLPDRASFFFGIGSVTPMLVDSFSGLGSLYAISDSALVGAIAPSAVPTFDFGTVRGQAITQAYNELLAQIRPLSDWYNVKQITIPYRTLFTDLLLVTNSPGVSFGLYVNDVLVGSTTANFQGWASFSVSLPAGTVDLKILANNSATLHTAQLAGPRFMSWIGAIADSLGAIDASIAQVRDSRSIERVRADDIGANFGAFVKTPRVSNYSLEVYRDLLIEVIQAFRYYSATPEGLQEVVAAFTQIRPILKWFRKDAPRWILGWQHLLNREMTARLRYAKVAIPGTNITAVTVSGSNENGTASILWTAGGQTLQYKSVGDSGFGAAVVVTGPGNYVLASLNGWDKLTVSTGTPLPATTTTIPVTVTGPALPQDVLVENANVAIVGGALMHLDGLRLQVTANAADPAIVMKADPTTFEHLGESFDASFWVRHDLGSDRHFVVEISEDGGSTWLPGSTPVAVPTGAYLGVSTQRSIGYAGITDIRVRVRGTDVVLGETFFLEKAALHSPQTGALYLGRNTIPRSRRRKFFGYLLLMMLRETLEIQAYTTLGLRPSLGWGLDEWGSSPYGSPSYGFFRPVLEHGSPIGLIRYIIPTHVEIDAFQDSVEASDNSGIVNVRGVIYEADWRAGTLVNFDVVPRSPDRFTHLRPSTTSVRTESILFNGSGIAELSRVSLQAPADCRLLKNGVPMPNTTWSYSDSTHIQLASLLDLDPDADFEFTYTAALTFQSDLVDLGANFGLFNWHADWYEYNRVRLDPISQPAIEPVAFSSTTLLAKISQRADTSVSGTRLLQNNGSLVTEVSTTAWRFIDSGTIKIESSVFDPASRYSFEFTAQSLVKKSVVTSVVEVQYSPDNLTFSPWTAIDHDTPFGNRFRYFRFRISVYDVGDLRDYRLRSMTLKGDPLDRTTIQGQV